MRKEACWCSVRCCGQKRRSAEIRFKLGYKLPVCRQAQLRVPKVKGMESMTDWKGGTP